MHPQSVPEHKSLFSPEEVVGVLLVDPLDTYYDYQLMNKSIRLLFVSTAILLLGSCGGGGSSSGGGSSNTTFPLAQAIANFVSKAESIPVTATGTVIGSGSSGTGSAIFSATAASAPANPPLPLLSSQAGVFLRTLSITGNVTSNTVTTPFDFETQVYYTTDYEPLGQNEPGLFCVFSGVTAKFPASVIAGQTGTIGTAACYQDDSQLIATGSLVSSFAIKTNTATTVTASLIDKVFDTGNTLQSTRQIDYQLDQNGNITFLSGIVTIPASNIALTFTAQ